MNSKENDEKVTSKDDQQIMLHEPFIVNTDKDSDSEKGINSDEIKLNGQSSNFEIISHILILSGPLIFGFVTYMLYSTLIYYSVSHMSLQVTEGKAILFIYYYTFSISAIWGFSTGFEIRGSSAFGNGDKREIERLLNLNYNMLMYISLFLMFFSTVVAKRVFSLLPFHPAALENFQSEIYLLSLTFPLLSVLSLLSRLGSLLQRNAVQLKAQIAAFIVFTFCSLYFIKYLDMQSYGMGLTYLITYMVFVLFLASDFYFHKPHGINVFTFKFCGLFDPQLKENFNFSLLPALNYIIVVLSAELNSYIALIISDLDFTVISIYFNIYSVTTQFFEALGNSMTIFLSYFRGQKNEQMIWRVWKITALMSLAFSAFIAMIFYRFSEQIFYLYSKDQSFNSLANKFSDVLALVIIFGGLHFSFSEFILVVGYPSFTTLTALILRFGVQLVLSFVLLYFYGYGIQTLLVIWLIVQVLSLLIFGLKIYRIKKYGLQLKEN